MQFPAVLSQGEPAHMYGKALLVYEKISIYLSDSPVTLYIINPIAMDTGERLALMEISQLILLTVWPVTLNYKLEPSARPLTQG